MYFAHAYNSGLSVTYISDLRLQLRPIMKFTILVSFPYRCYIPVPNLVKIGPVILEEKMLTHDDERQPIAIGHPSYSSDLKIECLLCSMFLRCCLSIQWTIFILLLILVRTPKLHRSEITTLSSQSNKRSNEIPIQSRES